MRCTVEHVAERIVSLERAAAPSFAGWDGGTHHSDGSCMAAIRGER